MPAGAAAAKKSSLGQPRSRRAEEKKEKKIYIYIWKVNTGGEVRPGGWSSLPSDSPGPSVLQCSLKGQMADERT